MNFRRHALLMWALGKLETHHIYMSMVVRRLRVHGDRDVALAQRSQLYKLRGDGNTDVRMRIGKFLGVRAGAEIGRIQRAGKLLARGLAVQRDCSWLRAGGRITEAKARAQYARG